MAAKYLKLVCGIFTLCLSCNMKTNIVGKYYHEKLGFNYTLELKENDTFVQTLIKGSDTFINRGRYRTSLNIVSFSPWRTRQELIEGGGCFGCELKYKNGKLYYYLDPDSLPEDMFIKTKE